MIAKIKAPCQAHLRFHPRLHQTVSANTAPAAPPVSTPPAADVYDEDIPFYQMVMHGVKSYGTSAVNASATPEETVLLAIASGSSLHFDMIGEETSTLKDTVLDGLYYASAESWTDYAAQSYAFSKAVLSGLGDQTITGYERKGDVITTTYENGTVVETDLAKQIVTVDGTAYAMADYVEEGSWNEA